MNLWRLGVVVLCQGLVVVACSKATQPGEVTSEPGVDSGSFTGFDSGGGGRAAGGDTANGADATQPDGAGGQDGPTPGDTGSGFDVFTGFDAGQPDCPDTGCFVPPPMDADIPEVVSDGLGISDSISPDAVHQ
jgi:hypothetical protein